MNGRLPVLFCAMAPSLALAQLPIPAVPAPASATAAFDSVPYFERPNGALMRAGSLTYILTLVKPDGGTIPLGIREVTVTDAPLGGIPSWLIAESRRGTAIETVDSVYLARADLSPERWSARIGRSHLGVSISRDTLFVAVDSHRGRSSFAAALPPGALLSAGMVERLIELLPLRAGYRASATLLLIDGPSLRAVPAEILVERDDRLMVAGRPQDSWLVVLRAVAIEQRLWVTKNGGRVARSEQAVSGGILTAELQP